MITYEEALSSAHIGNAVFIIGAGFSTEAESYLGEKLPTGNTLKRKLAEATGIDCNYSLEVIAQQYLDQFGEKQLLQLLKDTFIVNTIPEHYKLLNNLKKAHFYTTNYDNLLEETYKSSNKEIKSFQLSDNIKKAAKGLFVLHINGKIDKETENLDELRLTLDSYDKSFFTSPWIKYFCDDLRSADAVFIVGYSILADLDLRRLISNYKDKCFIIQYPELNLQDKRILQKYGRVIESGVNNFIKDLSAAQIPAKPNKKEDLKVKCFYNKSRLNVLNKANDQQVFDFIIKGNLSSKEILYQDETQKFKYLVNREKLLKAKEFLAEGSSIVIHSHLGNGKSVFLEQLVQLCPDYTFYVFESNLSKDFYKELDLINKFADKFVIVFDTYNANYDYIRYINHLGETSLRFIFFARTAMNDIFEDRLNRELSNLIIRNIDLNALSKVECAELNNILFDNGLWGKDAALSKESRLNIIEQKCKSNLQNTILYLFETSEVKKKFTNIIANSKSKNARKILIILFTNTVLELRLRNDDIEALYEIDLYSLLKKSGFSEFLQYSSANGWSVRSTVIAKAMLNSEAFTKSEILDTLKELTIKLDDLCEGCAPFINALKQLGSCSYLSFIFNYEINKNELLSYFEAVKSINFNKSNYFFWMQYAIACVNTHEYERAEMYFKTAYSFASKKSYGFSTFQIDNHFARFLLERQIYHRNPVDAFRNFSKAHNLLISAHRDIEQNDRYYQFKVAKCYKDFFEIFYQQFNEEEKKIFVSKCKEINSNLAIYEKETFNPHEGLRNDVLECKSNLKYILSNT